MTKKEHIKHWESQVDDDYDSARVLYKAGYYAQALFWAHLTLEKLCKALWIKTKSSNTPPFVHNLLRIILQTDEFFTIEELEFLSDMNTFQIRSRYPDYVDNLSETITKEVCEEYLEKTKNMIVCIREKLQ